MNEEMNDKEAIEAVEGWEVKAREIVDSDHRTPSHIKRFLLAEIQAVAKGFKSYLFDNPVKSLWYRISAKAQHWFARVTNIPPVSVRSLLAIMYYPIVIPLAILREVLHFIIKGIETFLEWITIPMRKSDEWRQNYYDEEIKEYREQTKTDDWSKLMEYLQNRELG